MVFKGLGDDKWSTQANWVFTDDTPANRLPAATDDVSIEALCYLNTTATAKSVTVQKDAALVLNGDSNLGDIPLILEDGAQLFPVDYQYELTATVKKEIKKNRWYLLSIPVDVNPDNIHDFAAAGMLEGNYDLFFFDQDYAGETEVDEENGEWRNYKYYVQNELDFIQQNTEQEPNYFGYLYANGSNTTLSFQGAILTDEEWSNQRIPWNNSSDFVGFNLLGNPYPCNAMLTFGNKIDLGQIYMMKEDGSGLVPLDHDASTSNDVDTELEGYFIVPPFATFFIVATANNRNAKATFSPAPLWDVGLLRSVIIAAENDDTRPIYLPAHNQTGNHDADEEPTVIPVTGVTLSQTEAALTVGGETLTLTATVAPDNGTNRMVTWTTSDAAVATVTDTGVVTAVGAGTATITVTATNGTADDTSDDKTATCTVTVSTAGTTQYAVTVKDGTADADKWTASPNPAEAGETVTVTYSGKKKVKTVTVTKKE